MTDTRSPEQRRTDELSLAWVTARQRSERVPRHLPDDRSDEIKAYQAGHAAALAGFTSRGTPGMEAHEQRCTDAQNAGHGDQWAAGYRDGTEQGS